MIDTSHRFQGHGSLRFAYQRGQTIRGQHCSLRFIENKRRDTYRVAVVVSKKVNKSAVVRNRIRRRLYEVVRSVAPRINGSYDLVFIVYSDQLAEMPAPEVRRAIVEKLERAGVLTEKKTPAS
jgi:ribonuclease P protein component